MKLRRYAAASLLLVKSALVFGACGGIAVLPTPEEVCLDGGGEWGGGDCGGGYDHCGLTICEHAIGEGCVCPSEEECWDGTACVPIGGQI